MATFHLTNINLQTGSKLFTKQSRKLLKIEISQPKSKQHKLLKLKSCAQFVSESSLAWKQQLVLPAKTDKAYPFEIVSQQSYQFGYNPEALDKVMQGKILIKKDEGDYSGWQVFSQDKSVGYLFANIQFYDKLGKKKDVTQIDNSAVFFGNTIEAKKDSLFVTSIYANFPILNPLQKLRVYIQFELGGIPIRSAIKRLHKNEYHSYQHLEIPHPNARSTKLTVSAVVFDSHLNKTIKIGQGLTNLLVSEEDIENIGKMKLEERVKIERIFFFNEHDEEVGWVSFKYIKTKDECLDPRFFLQDKFNTIGDINFRPLKNTEMTISMVKGSPLRMSGLQKNSRIFIPKSNRFEDPSKRKLCDKIGISHGTIDLKDLPSTNKYRTASFGYGYKQQPVERDKSIPGPARYQLPVLFDCYKYA